MIKGLGTIVVFAIIYWVFWMTKVHFGKRKEDK
jgi:hypothetical protein